VLFRSSRPKPLRSLHPLRPRPATPRLSNSRFLRLTRPLLAVSSHFMPATIEEWLAIPEERRAELIDGVIACQGMPGPLHGRVQGKTFAQVDGPFGRPVGNQGFPGGWWISLKVDTEIGGAGCRPDILGWRRDNHPRLPEPDPRGVVIEVPEWICEVLSPRTASIDLGKKRRAYHRAGVAHYWLVDPTNSTLTVLEHSERDYLIVLVAGRGEAVNAPPFEGVEIAVAEIFGDGGTESEAEASSEPPGS
jgi:Uma2 family endonuclease